MDRRDFNRGVVVALIGIPAVRLLAACGRTQEATLVLDLGPAEAPGPGFDASSPTQFDLGATDLAEVTNSDLASVVTPDLAPTMITYTSTIDASHTHQITLETSLYASPPVGGILRMSTVALDHSHAVSLSQAHLTAIANGTVLTIPTGVTNGHSHCFHFANHA